MRKFNTTDLIVVSNILICVITGSIMISVSNIFNQDETEKSNDSLGYVGIGFTVIAGICVIIFLVRTGIDLTRPTITSTNIEGVSQINPGIPL